MHHPRHVQNKGVVLSGSSGVYCSEKYVVVERYHHRFPHCCIWCGKPLAPEAVPASPDDRGDIRPPVCKVCTATRNRLPKTVGIFGLFTFVAAPLAYSSFGILVAAALLLTGFIDLAIAWWLYVAARGVRAVREDQQYVWIGGAATGFLGRLPQWHGMKLAELQAQHR